MGFCRGQTDRDRTASCLRTSSGGWQTRASSLALHFSMNSNRQRSGSAASSATAAIKFRRMGASSDLGHDAAVCRRHRSMADAVVHATAQPRCSALDASAAHHPARSSRGVPDSNRMPRVRRACPDFGPTALSAALEKDAEDSSKPELNRMQALLQVALFGPYARPRTPSARTIPARSRVL